MKQDDHPIFNFDFDFDKIKSLWNKWDLRGAVLVSLSFQILLLFIASSRKRTKKMIIALLLWSAYLLADWVATFAIGLIANGPNDCTPSTNNCQQHSLATIAASRAAHIKHKAAINNDLYAFWASFLLGHLGGPHTITAFSLEDNELWIRHLLQLSIHLIGIAYIFSQSLPNRLWLPIGLVYFAGLIKYAERIRALYLASLGTLKTSTLPKPMAGSNYARLMQAYRSKLDASIPVNIVSTDTPEVEPPPPPSLDVATRNTIRTEIEAVQTSFGIFNTFKGLLVDITYGYRDWQKTRESFFRKTWKDAFKLMEIELNFLYDLLYTKMSVVHGKTGFLVRFVCLACNVLALERFASHHKHFKDIDDLDISISYTLLIGAIGLDTLAFIMLFFTDWTVACLPNWPTTLKNCTTNLLTAFFYIREKLPFVKHRWSQCLSQHNLIYYCLKNVKFSLISKTFDLMGAKEPFDEFKYRKDVPVKDDLKQFIFNELRDKAVKANNAKEAKEICSWRGENVLLEAPRFYTSLKESVEVEYDESVLRWHVATQLCYYTTEEEKSVKHRQFCKILSEYMLYLLVMRPTMMSAVAGIVQIRFQDTCEETKKFFRGGEELTVKKFLADLLRKPKNAFEDAKKFFQNPRELPKVAKKFFTTLKKLLETCFEKAKKLVRLPALKLSELLKELIKFFGCMDHEDEASTARFKAIKEGCERLLAVDTVVAPDKVKAGTSRSVLFDGCIMAKDLKNLRADERWEIMSKVWVELLGYAASHCRAHAHAQQLSKGGEFITFVWLQMIHFGMGEPFRVDPESRYKLVVAK